MPRPRKYQLENLLPGEQMIVGNSQAHDSVQVQISKFNKANPSDYPVRSRKLDAGILIYRDGPADVMQAAAASNAVLPTTQPSELELLAYLATMTNLQCLQFTTEYKPRFVQLQQWILACMQATPMRFACTVVNDVLTIQRLPDSTI
jgi:hypothetical protein